MILNIFGTIITIVSCVLAYNWFGWKLVLVLILFGWGLNMENHKDEKD